MMPMGRLLAVVGRKQVLNLRKRRERLPVMPWESRICFSSQIWPMNSKMVCKNIVMKRFKTKTAQKRSTRRLRKMDQKRRKEEEKIGREIRRTVTPMMTPLKMMMKLSKME
jgi:hypothetical protein